jgi:putative membrane protein
MTSRKPRRPAAFRLDDPSVSVERTDTGSPRAKTARGRTIVTPEDADPFAPSASLPVTPSAPQRRRWRPGRLFAAAAAALVSLAAGIWVTDFVSGLFARAEWLGWTGLMIAALAGMALLALVAREIAGLMRLARVTRLRAEADEAAARDDREAARDIARRLVALYASRPETARGRASLKAHASEIIDGRDLLRLAEHELMTALDAQARTLITASAQRVSMVTAISPRAIIDVLFVAVEGLRLIRRIGALYGGRPSGLALMRLTRLALGHLAITGGLAMTDGLVHQMVGQGLAARLSARLGEGVINGLMTARIGLAALDVCRPLPWLANRPPGLRDVMSTLAGAGQKPPRATPGTAE